MIMRLRNIKDPSIVKEVEVEDIGDGWFQDSAYFRKTEWEEVLQKPVQDVRGGFIPGY